MLKNVRIGSKLAGILIVNIVLFIIIGLTASFSADSIYEDLQLVFRRDLSGLSFLLEADRDLHQALIAERTILFVDPESEEFAEQMDAYTSNKEQADTRVRRFAETSSSSVQLELVDAYFEARKAWDEVSLKLLADKKAGADVAELARISRTEGAKRFDAMRDHIDKLTEFLGEQKESIKVSASNHLHHWSLW